MTIYTFSEARQKLASVLEKAKTDGRVLVKRKDGSLFAIQPVSKKESPLDVEGIDIGLSADEIVGIVREVRER
ncbi:MAG: type II toxin-antitoxin system Phd/YefM family antitoxin [Desulfobacterales bacterium]|nr:type II toxin-antitoxin system Phd/YefM family antitoxin [Desulfobacterales bacterium]